MYAGSFDPFTKGHESVVRRALDVFDSVVVAIGANSNKCPLLSVESRLALIRKVFAGEPRVTAVAYEGLTVDAAQREGAGCLLRGIRGVSDMDEQGLAEVNRRLTGIPTVLMFTLPEHAHISSTVVRDLLRWNRSADDLLPTGITTETLQSMINDQIK